MSDLKWIKIRLDMFDNRKIKYLRSLPEGDKIVLIWIQLLVQAGKCNAGGHIFISENVPYTIDSLANELQFDKYVV